jgi:hypothetical protein
MTMAQDGFQMKADAALARDIQKCESHEELLDLLHASLERSGIASRDPETGQFVRRDPLTPAAQDAKADEPEKISKTETINGRAIDFSGTEAEIELQVASARRVAEALRPTGSFTPRLVRTKTQAEIERDICDRAELDLQFRRGELTTQEYLERTNAVGNFLAEQGFDVQAAAAAQMQQGWKEATAEFLNGAGSSWPGGTKNREVLGLEILALGLRDAEDKVAALTQAYESMQKKGLMFQGDVSPEEIIKMTEKMSPTEILEAFKHGQNGDPEAANKAFIDIHRKAGDSSGIFNR